MGSRAGFRPQQLRAESMMRTESARPRPLAHTGSVLLRRNHPSANHVAVNSIIRWMDARTLVLGSVRPKYQPEVYGRDFAHIFMIATVGLQGEEGTELSP